MSDRKLFVVIVGPSHAGKFVLLNVFQSEPNFGICTTPLWPDDFISKFYKDSLGIDVKSPRMHMDATNLDRTLLYNFNLNPDITMYYKDSIPQKYYLAIVNNQFKTSVNRLLNDSNIYIPLVRDPRILWIVDRCTDDKSTDEFSKYFFLAIDEFTEVYKKHLLEKPMLSLIRFEDLNINFEFEVKSKILDKYVYDYDKSLKIPRCSQKVNEFFTTDDRDNNKWFGYKDQEKLDMVSERCKEYIELFNYKPMLTVEDIYKGTDVL